MHLLLQTFSLLNPRITSLTFSIFCLTIIPVLNDLLFNQGGHLDEYKYDYLVVGSCLYGAIFAHEANKEERRFLSSIRDLTLQEISILKK